MRRAADKKDARWRGEEREQDKDALTASFPLYITYHYVLFSYWWHIDPRIHCDDWEKSLFLMLKLNNMDYWTTNLGQMAGEAALAAVRGFEDS